MKKKLLAMILLGGAGLCLLIPTTMTLGQPGFGGKGGKGGKGGGGGGFSDATQIDKMFDWMSKGRGFVVISESKGFSDPMQEWANSNGVTGGQMTRDQFQSFGKWYQAKLDSGEIQSPFGKGGKGGGKGAFGPGGFAGGPGGPGGKQGGPTVDLDALAVERFKQADVNGDGFLTEDEMSGKLKGIQPNGEPLWKKFDKNQDGKLDLVEYKAYFKEASQELDGALSGAEALILEEEWEKRPSVLRAGKLPKEMPSWFSELDTDKDGQVGYYEWRKSGKTWEEFNAMDRNGDGLLTAEEVIWYLKIKIRSTTGDDAVDTALQQQRPNNFGQGNNRMAQFQQMFQMPGGQFQMNPGMFQKGPGGPGRGPGGPAPGNGGTGGPPGKGGKGKGKGGGNNNNG
jgi:Ca2+-binding EF-hand superfamily protein